MKEYEIKISVCGCISEVELFALVCEKAQTPCICYRSEEIRGDVMAEGPGILFH